MAHVATWKKDKVSELTAQMIESPVVAIVDVHGIPGPQIQEMRAGLREKAVVMMAKNKLLLLALEEAAKEKPGLEELRDAVGGQCAMVATGLSPFRLFRQLESGKTAAPAKPGDVAPMDIVIPKGPTKFAPGPIIGDLQKIGIPAAIDGGKIVVRKETKLVEEGQTITAGVASMLPKLDILPMVVGMDLVSAYEDGMIYGREMLDIPEDHYQNLFASAAYSALALGFEIAFPTRETVPMLIAKAAREAMGLSVSAAIPTRDTIGILLSRADSQMLSLARAVGSDDERLLARLSAAPVAAAAAPETPAAVEEEEEEDEVSEDEAAAGLSALFG